MKKITGKQIKLAINIICLALFCISYLYLSQNYEDKAEAVYKKVNIAKAELKIKKQKLSEEASVQQELTDVNLQIQEIIDSFPVKIMEEDNYMFVEQLEEELNIKTSSISTSDDSVLYNTILPVRGETPVDAGNNKEAAVEETAAEEKVTEEAVTKEEATKETATDEKVTEEVANQDTTAGEDTMTAVFNTLTMNFMTDYQNFKNLVDYIRDYPEPTIIDKVSLNYDSSTGNLAGNLVLKRFALIGSGKEYKAPDIDGIEIGIDNLFGTGAD